jgi:hypothetical protein
MYEVELPDGTIIEVPDDMPQAEAKQRILKSFPQYADKQSIFRQVADVPLGIAQGAVSTTRMLANMFGAGSGASKTLKGAEDYIADFMSAQSKSDAQEMARIQKEAEDKGAWEQVKAGLKAFSVAPIDTLSSAAGSAVPFVLGSLGAAAAGAPVGIGTGIGALLSAGAGAGTIKGSIYEATKQALVEAGASPQDAEKRAQTAQEYGGKNLDQILLGTVLGGVAGYGPLEKGAARILSGKILGKAAAEETGEAATKGAIRQRVEAGAMEALPEALQAGQEQVAANLALQREGMDAPTFRGAFSAAALEGIAGAGLGAAVGGHPQSENLRQAAERLQAEISALRAQEQTEQTQQALADKEQQMVGLQSAMTAAVSNEARQPRRGVSPELGQLMETNREQQGIAGILAGQKTKGFAGTLSPGITSSTDSLAEFNQLLVPTISPYATGLESALTAAETSGGVNRSVKTASLAPSQQIMGQGSRMPFPTGLESALEADASSGVNRAAKRPSLAPSQQVMGQGTRMPFPTGVNAAVGVPPKKSLRIEPFTLDALAEIPWEAKSFTEVGKPMDKATGSSRIVDLAGRKIVLADVNGTQVPFYLSSGAGGKDKVQAGKWYPFFGVGADGWMNKGSQDQINSYYGAPALASMAKQLDENIGDIRDDRSIPAVGATGRHIDAINNGLSPADNDRADTTERFQNNAMSLLEKVGQAPLQMPATPRGATEVPFSKPAEIDLDKERLVDLQKGVLAAEKQRRSIIRNSHKLWATLRNKLDRYSVTDISPDKSYSALLNKERGRDLSSLVADGEVDAFLPPRMRSTSEFFDEIDATNYIKDLLATSKTHLEYERNIQLRALTDSIDEMTSEINALVNDNEANQLLQQAYDEQRRIDQEADAAESKRTDSDTGKSTDTTGKPASPEVTKELTERQKLIIQKTQELQKVLQKMLGQMGMRDVALKITADLTDADGEYSSKLIRLAFDAANPLQTMRHEAIHALKALGFFSPKQWETLTKMAKDTWIPRLKTVDINQQPLEEGGTSRYDAYVNLFTSENKTPAQIEEALLEEAIADAFGEFDATSSPPGLLAAIVKRMRNLFAALKATFSGNEDVEQIFRKVEAGRLKSKTQDGDAEAKQSLRGEVPLSTRTIMEANDEFARAELGLKIKPVRGIANKVRDIAIALNAQTKNEREQMNRQALSVENEKAIASAIADEVAYQLTAGKRSTGTGLGWYSTNYPNAVKYLSKRFPELQDNPHARSVFSALVAVTSNGEKVTKNIDNAIELYSKIRDGKPLIAMGNRRATALENNLKVIEELLAEHGTNFEKVLLEEITVREMNAKLRALDKKADGSYLARTRVPAAAVYFGPKLGAFYANLSGSEGYLTMDLWWTRSINRMRGLLISKATDASIIKFRDMMGDPSLDRDAVVAAAVPLRNKYEEYGFITELEHLVGAKEPAKNAGKPAWEKKAQEVAGAAYDQLKYEHSLEKMSNTIYKNEFEVLQEAPFTATDRAFMYRAGRRAQSMLRSEGIDLTLADIQAALWYYEKRLYEKLSGKKANDIGYEEAILAHADSANRRARPSVVFSKRDDSGDVTEGEVSDASEVSGKPTKAQSRGLKKSLRAPQTEAFKQWFGNSKIVGKDGKPRVMYHGTARDINVFKPKQANAIFLTGDREFAEGFASMSLDWVARNYKDMLTPNQLVEARAFAERLGRQTYSRNPKLAEQITKDLRQGKDTEDATDLIATAVKQMLDKTKRVMEVYVRAEKPFDYDNADHIKQVADLLPATVRAEVAFSDEPGISYTKLDAIEKLKTGEWDIVESKPVQKAIRELGFDSFYTQEGGEKNIAVYNSNQIKSATNNEGTYDITNPDIRKSLRATEVPKEDAKKFWQGAANIERTEGVEAAEEAWIGGVADFGDRAAARDIQEMPGYIDYQDSIANLARQHLAQNSRNQFYVYRYGNLGLKDEVLLNEEYDALDPKATTLSINFAKKFKHFAGFDEDLDPDANMGWMRIAIYPETIVMVGKPGENELVIDPNSLTVDDIEIIDESFEPSKPEAKFSLRAPNTQAQWTEKRIDRLINEFGYTDGRTKAYAANINPSDFVYATTGSEQAAREIYEEAGALNADDLANQTQTPFLYVETSGKDWKIEGHEGRHRMAAMDAAGVTEAPVVLIMYKNGGRNPSMYKPKDKDDLQGQEFSTGDGAWAQVRNLVPLSYQYTKELNDKFGKDGLVKFSLRGTPAKAMPVISQAAEDAVTRTTVERDEKGFIRNILDAISPKNFTSFRAEFLNRYNGLSLVDKRRVEKMGGAAAMADVSAESAALLSDVGAGITAAVFGVDDKVGGAPVYARTYYVVKNDQILPARYKTEAEAKKAAGPTGSVRSGGHTTVSNFNNTVKGPLAIFAPLAAYNNPRVYQHYQFWAAVKRGKRFTAEGREQLLTKQDELLAKEYEKAYPEFVSIQKEWIKYNDQLVQYMVDTGVLSKERAKIYTEHSDYIPFYRQIEGSDKAVGPSVFSAISGVKPPKMAKGSTAVLDDFLETIVRNSQSAIQAGIKNLAAQKAVEAATDVGIATKLPTSSGLPNVVVVHENGVPTYYNCEDALFVNAVKSLGMSEIPFLNVLAAPANLLREMVTKEPTFLLANMLRDSLSAYVTSGTNMTPVLDTFKNFGKALAGKSPEFVALTKSGILGGYEFTKGVDMGGRKFGEMLNKKADVKPNGLFPNVVGYGKSLWGVLEKGSSASDAATRMEIYKRTLAETGNETEAIFRSLEVMNFNRKGRNALVRVFTAMAPFINARMQGLDILYRTALEPSVSGQPVSARQRQLQRSFFLRGAMMAGLSCLYWLLVHDDDDYKKQEQETKDNNWLVPGLGVRMPTPFEVGFFFKTVPERIMALAFGDDTMKDFRESMTRGVVSTLKVVPVPLLVLPVMENLFNFSTFTGRPIVGPGTSDLEPGYQVNTNTAQIIADLGRELNISPIKIEHAIQGYTGQMGMYMVSLVDAMWNANNPIQKPAKQFYQLPMIKRFAMDPDARGKLTQFYELKNDVDTVVRTSNDLERSGQFDELDAYQKGKMGLLDNKEYVLAIERSLADIRDQKKEILSSDESPEEKRDALLELQKMENDLVENIQEIRKEAYGPD